tara:strand:- start:21675 stop:22148 length:474 start_codon:yes stop_codon:yes gene_type:complete
MIEDALVGVQVYIAANLTARLDAIETARSVTIPRALAADIAVGFVLSKQFPNISIVPADTAYEYSDPETPYVLPLSEHGVSVIVDHSEADETERMLTIARYVEAITQMTFDDWTYGALFNKVQLAGTEYGLITAHDDKTISHSADITLMVRILPSQS